MSFSVSSMGNQSDLNMALGITKNEDRQNPFVLYNCVVLRHKKRTTKLLMFVFSFDSNNKLNDLILLEKAHVF